MGDIGRRSSLEEFVYKTILDKISLPRDEWMQAIKQWHLEPITHSGELAAVVMINGNEVHVAVEPKYRRKWLGKDKVNQVLGGLLSEYGQVVTAVNYDNALGRTFVERLGFVPDTVTYKLEKLRHEK